MCIQVCVWIFTLRTNLLLVSSVMSKGFLRQKRLGSEETAAWSRSGLALLASLSLVKWGRICCTAAILTLLIMSRVYAILGS